MQFFPSRRATRRAETRLVWSFFAWSAISFVVVLAVIVLHYWLGGEGSPR
jgi:hypothetical protein